MKPPPEEDRQLRSRTDTGAASSATRASTWRYDSLEAPGPAPGPASIPGTWIKSRVTALRCGDLIWHGQRRRITSIKDVSNRFGHVLRLDLDSGEQIHRYPADRVYVWQLLERSLVERREQRSANENHLSLPRP